MKSLLIITRKVDNRDERMSFFIDWLNEFAKHVETLYVISWQEGSVQGLAENINVTFIETVNRGLFWKLKKVFEYRRVVNEELLKVDGVFVHMNALYGNLVKDKFKQFRKDGKKVFLWYMHKSVNRVLKKSRLWVDGYISASKESFRMETDLPVYTFGHAIPVKTYENMRKVERGNGPLRIITIGRIAPSKDTKTLIEAIFILVSSQQLDVRCSIVGAPAMPEDKKYLEMLKDLVVEKKLNNVVTFEGPKPYREVLQYYANADIFVNMSNTGSIDKVVLEAMASGVIPISANESLKPILDPLDLTVPLNDAKALAERIVKVEKLSAADKTLLLHKLKALVITNHNISYTIEKIVSLFLRS